MEKLLCLVPNIFHLFLVCRGRSLLMLVSPWPFFSYQPRSASEKNVTFYCFSFSLIHLMFVSFHQKTMDWHSPLCTCSWLYISMAAPFRRLCWSHHLLRTITIGLTFVGVNGIAQRMKLGLEIQVPPQGEISCKRYIPYTQKNYVPHSWH